MTFNRTHITCCLPLLVLSLGCGQEEAPSSAETKQTQVARQGKSKKLLPGLIPLPKAVPTTTTKTKQDDYSAYERNFLEATNRARKGQGAPALRINSVLARLARTHAARMARAGDVATRIGGVSLSDEVENSGYDYLAVGPVVSAYPVLDFDYILRDLQTDAGIRKMLLDGGYVDIGIGIAKGDGKVFYLVQILGSPDSGE